MANSRRRPQTAGHPGTVAGERGGQTGWRRLHRLRSFQAGHHRNGCYGFAVCAPEPHPEPNGVHPCRLRNLPSSNRPTVVAIRASNQQRRSINPQRPSRRLSHPFDLIRAWRATSVRSVRRFAPEKHNAVNLKDGQGPSTASVLLEAPPRFQPVGGRRWGSTVRFVDRAQLMCSSARAASDSTASLAFHRLVSRSRVCGHSEDARGHHEGTWRRWSINAEGGP